MRETLAGLTVRGRAFLAAGATTVVCAVLLGQPTLTRVGVLVLALPLLTALLLALGRYRLALVRTLQPETVTAGQSARVDLTLTNEGRTPSGVLLMEDQLPYVLGTRPRFVLEGIGRGWKRHVSYQVRPDVRGHYEIGPMTVRVTDPFGLVELGRSFRSTAPLTVTPRTVPLPTVALGGGWTGSGDNHPRSFATGSAEDVTVREYRRGDDLRRVHWRSSARVGELMVRREEQPWQSRATLFLDNRAVAHRGQGIASSLETAVSAVASIAIHLSQRGYSVRLVTASGEDPSTTWHVRGTDQNTGPLLEALAMVRPLPEPHLDSGWLTEHHQGGLTVAVVGLLEPYDLPVLRRMQHHTSTALAVTLDAGAWQSPPSEPGTAANLLSQHGWRCAEMRPGDPLPRVWEDLARKARSRPEDRAAGAPGRGLVGEPT